jgi:hypothetical protein
MQFDPMQYMDMETTEEAKKRPPLPVRDYPAIISDLVVKPWANDEGKSGMQALVTLDVEVPLEVQEAIGYKPKDNTMRFTDRPFIDINEGGAIDWSPGANRRLRQYRVAADMNKAGESFSLRRLVGRPVLVKITHEMYQGETQERIGGVAPRG